MDSMAFVPRDDNYPKKVEKHHQQSREELSHDDGLHSAKPIENIPTENSNLNDSTQDDTKGSLKTVFEKINLLADKTDSITDSTIVIDVEKALEKKSNEASPIQVREPQSVPLSKKELIENNDTSKSASNIYTVDGSASTRINRRRTNTSSVFPVGCMGCKDESLEEQIECPVVKKEIPEVNSSTLNGSAEVERSSLTGTETQQDTRRRMIRRKDGNPLLGVGYDDTPHTMSNTACKVPPGGFSHGLW